MMWTKMRKLICERNKTVGQEINDVSYRYKNIGIGGTKEQKEHSACCGSFE